MARRGPSVWFIAAIILYAACAVLGARLLWSDATDPGAADLTAQRQRFEAKARVARVCRIASVAALACMLIDFGLKGRRFYLRRVPVGLDGAAFIPRFAPVEDDDERATDPWDPDLPA